LGGTREIFYMANLHTPIHSVATRIDVGRGTRTSTEIGLFQCMIVSTDSERRQMLAQAAFSAHWQPLTCCDPTAGLVACGISELQLAIVDLEGSTIAEFQPLLDRLAQVSGLLLVVCGKQSDQQEERHVRQIGAWLYLPGAIEPGQMTLLCGEARAICLRDRENAKSSPRLPGPGACRPRTRRR
jgi:hypothetical protein